MYQYCITRTIGCMMQLEMYADTYAASTIAHTRWVETYAVTYEAYIVGYTAN